MGSYLSNRGRAVVRRRCLVSIVIVDCERLPAGGSVPTAELLTRFELSVAGVDLHDRRAARRGELAREVDGVLPVRKAPAARIDVVVVNAPHRGVTRADDDG